MDPRLSIFRNKWRRQALLIIHIPKTAGTSLRVELCKNYSRKKIAMDYGEVSPDTSKWIKKHLYGQGGTRPLNEMREILEQKNVAALIGHFTLKKYQHIFPAEYTAAFVREPLARTASEYLHFQREMNYTASFREFMERADIINRQSKYLANSDDKMFIGVTEKLQKSIQLFNERFEMDLRHIRTNVARNGGAAAFIEKLPPDLVTRYYELNEIDVELYNRVVSTLN